MHKNEVIYILLYARTRKGTRVYFQKKNTGFEPPKELGLGSSLSGVSGRVGLGRRAKLKFNDTRPAKVLCPPVYRTKRKPKRQEIPVES